jgi:hypothetical protein
MKTIDAFRRIADPPEEEDSSCLVYPKAEYGDGLPRAFCLQNERPDSVSKADWDRCISGPFDSLYWESWGEIVRSWFFFSADQLGNKFSVTLEYDEDLIVTRTFVGSEYSKKNVEFEEL